MEIFHDNFALPSDHSERQVPDDLLCLLLRSTAHVKPHTPNSRSNNFYYMVCICEKLVCLRKCCPLGQAFVNNTCNPHNLDIEPNVYGDDLSLIADYGVSNFHRIYGDTCLQKSFQLEPEIYPSDEHYLMLNGTLVLPNDNAAYDASQFCFENVLKAETGGVAEKVLRAFICFPEVTETEDRMIVYPIGMIISMPFLLATFIVYSLPELRNLHGKNLMSEVAALLTAYIVLVTTQLAGHAISDSLCVTFGKNCSIKCSIVLQLCTSSLSVVSSSLGYLLSPPKHLSLTHYPVSQYYEIKEWG
ncbi:hypothetical protein RUM44_008172 [Polyplax serrata]|uniref:Methuselah N-terminal domain-containing protein n=1 Tax=Polyplax serrata TaxID=468196 RepID=A0ABR1BBZ2_POLSC